MYLIKKSINILSQLDVQYGSKIWTINSTQTLETTTTLGFSAIIGCIIANIILRSPYPKTPHSPLFPTTPPSLLCARTYLKANSEIDYCPRIGQNTMMMMSLRATRHVHKGKHTGKNIVSLIHKNMTVHILIAIISHLARTDFTSTRIHSTSI